MKTYQHLAPTNNEAKDKYGQNLLRKSSMDQQYIENID